MTTKTMDLEEYIKKSDVQKLLYECTPKWENFAQVFSFLKWMETITTINPEGVLEEMIKELKFLWSDYTENPIILLKEAQVRIRNQS